MNELEKTNTENKTLADTIVETTVTDWVGNELFASDNYYKALDYYFELMDNLEDNELDDIYLNSFDKDGINHGIFY